MTSGLALVTGGPHVGEETNPCSGLSATDVTDELVRKHDSGTELCCKVLLSPTLCCCVVETGVLRLLHTDETGTSPLRSGAGEVLPSFWVDASGFHISL